MSPDKDSPLVFVVEDEPDIARLIAATLAEYGFRSETFRTGRAPAGPRPPVQPELAILDLGLPDMDGLQVLRELQEQHPCAALILTGRDGLTDRVLGLELGADDYLVKPFEPRGAGRPGALNPAPLPEGRQPASPPPTAAPASADWRSTWTGSPSAPTTGAR